MSSSDLKSSILAAYRRLLRPLVRILIRNNVSFAEFSEVAKNVYVEVAEGDFQAADNNTKQDRIAILTGLTRNEVQRLVERRGRSRVDTASNLDRITGFLGGWHTDPYFTGPYGLPLDVPFDGVDDRTFAELVRRYAGGMHPGAMLSELLRIGVVRETDGGRIKVLTRTYLPQSDTPDSLDRLGRAVGLFVETIDFNRDEADPDKRLFERTVVADNGIRVSDLPELQAYVRERGQFLLEEIDDWLSKLEPIPANCKEETVQTGIGVYHYIESSDTNSRT